ncbi:hypothetical protein NC651_018756 [Populus alba x Populus x berolinensis]|nr:hypothetical protein NC651_018756 [Populus alba x Populus x berolinensis]
MCRIRFPSLIDLFFLFVELLFIRAAWQSRSPPQDGSSLENYSTEGSIGDIYHSKEYFLRNYEAMQRDFKVFVYPGGNPTACYDPKDKLRSKYASEHYFMNLIDSQFLTDDPQKAQSTFNSFLYTFQSEFFLALLSLFIILQLLSCLTTMTCHSMINFSGILKEDDVLYLEQILERIPEEKFKKMRQNVSQAGEHSKWHSTRVGSYMTSFTWLCMSYGSVDTSLSTQLLGCF